MQPIKTHLFKANRLLAIFLWKIFMCIGLPFNIEESVKDILEKKLELNIVCTFFNIRNRIKAPKQTLNRTVYPIFLKKMNRISI